MLREGEKDRRLVELEMQLTRLQRENQFLREKQGDQESTEQQLAFFHKHSPIGYISFDGKANIRDLNPAAVTLIGKKREGLLRTPFVFLVASSDATLFLDHLKRCRAAKNERTVT